MNRAKRVRVSVLLGLGSLCLLGLAGCPAKLDNAEDFPPIYLDEKDGACQPLGVFYRRCGGSGCHLKGFSAAGGMQLAVPDAYSKLVDQWAQHGGVPAGSLCPVCDKLIDTQNPQESWLYKKINDDVGSCGTRMPPIGSLSKADFNCLVDFISNPAKYGATSSNPGPCPNASDSGAGTAGSGGTGGTSDGGSGTAGTGG